MMRELSILLAVCVLSASNLLAQSAGGISTQSVGTSGSPLSTVLRTDGSVRSNFNGSFDASGYRLTYGPNGEPRFVDKAQPRPASCNDGWDSGFSVNGANGVVYAAVSDGAGNVYVGGEFSAVNNVAANGVAKWNGTTWSALGSGVSGTVRALAISGSDVYVAGSFLSVGGVPSKHVAKWDGNAWSALGDVSGNQFATVHAIAVSGGNVYAGGDFSGGVSPNRIARWDGTSWSSMGTGMDNRVVAIAVSGSNVYAGGWFSTAGGVAASRIAKWDGASWSAMGSLTGTVSEVAVSGTDVYIGGDFDASGVRDIAKWNGTTWDGLGSGINQSYVSAMTISGTDIYVGGGFTSAGGSTVTRRVARWDGNQWSWLGTSFETSPAEVWGIAVSGNTVFAGGEFQTAGGISAKNIATWTAGTWSGFPGNSLDGSVSAVAVSGTDVYVAGAFLNAGSLPVNRIAKWNGSAWSALGTAVGDIRALAVSGGYVYASGTFSSIGGVPANKIARWNGTGWSALGSGLTGLNGTAGVITAVGEDLYVGGSFNTAGGSPAHRIAKWNGTSWSGLPGSTIIPNDVVAIAPAGSDLYVGSATTTAEDPNYFLKFDGTNWTALGAGMGGHSPSSIAVLGTDVYVAGGFPSIGGLTVNRIAKWNGSSWSALGNGLPSPFGFSGVIRLAVSGSDLIAAGDFTVATGGPADRIARWNGRSWSAFGAGLSGNGSVAVQAGGDIWVGGGFITAGCNLSPYLARWRETVWTGSTSSDWHTPANWGGGSIPGASAGVSILANNASITSADVSVSSLIIAGGRTLTIGAGRNLTVNGVLDVSNGSLVGPGTLIVNGDLRLNGGTVAGMSNLTVNGVLDVSNGSLGGPGTLVVNGLRLNGGTVAGMSSITVNGNVHLVSGTIAGTGPVNLTACRASAVVGGSATAFVNSPLTRCVNSAGTYLFPVGSNGVYAPVELANIAGSGTFTVEPKTGAYSGAAAGLPPNRLNRWWSTTNGGITQGDLTFTYTDSEVVGLEARYKVFAINGGIAQVLTTMLNTTSNRASATGVTSFSAFTMAEGPSTPQMLNGRVRGASGRGAHPVLVSITDSGGNIRWTMTNPFGYYRFQNVMTWETYTVRVLSKRYTFSNDTQTFLFPENAPNVNFTATNH